MMNVDKLTVALKELIGNAALHTTALRLGEHVRTEKGINNAVHLIEETFCPEEPTSNPR